MTKVKVVKRRVDELNENKTNIQASQDELSDGLTKVSGQPKRDRKVSRQVPRSIKSAFVSCPPDAFIQTNNYHISRIPCIRFWPQLFALIVPEDFSQGFLESKNQQKKFASWVISISNIMDRHGELAFVLFVPYRKYEEDRKQGTERPVAIFTKGLSPLRRQTLVETVMSITGAKFAVADRFSGVSAFLSAPAKGIPLYGSTLQNLDYIDKDTHETRKLNRASMSA